MPVEKRYWIRDEFDGTWSEHDTEEEAKSYLALMYESDPSLMHRYDLRIDDMDS